MGSSGLPVTWGVTHAPGGMERMLRVGNPGAGALPRPGWGLSVKCS